MPPQTLNGPANPAMDIIQGYQNLVHGVSLGLALIDQWYTSLFPAPVPRLPPFPLRLLAQGSPDIPSFLVAGQESRRAIDAAVAKLGKWTWDFPNILDFGSGCGRTLIQMRDLVPQVTLWGTDIAEESVRWCQRHLPFAKVGLNKPLPPLEYENDKFDLIYAMSVFTHLEESAQFAWLAELNRVLKPGGILLLTFLGYDPDRQIPPITDPAQVALRALTGLTLDPWREPSPDQLAQLREHGFVFVPTKVKWLFYEGYGTAYHRRDYIKTRYAAVMGVVEYLPDALLQTLDLAVLRKRT